MTRQKTKTILIAVTIACTLLFALIEQLFRPDYIVKTILMITLYMIPAFAVHKANPNILYSDLFARPGKALPTVLMLGFGMFLFTRGCCDKLLPYLDLSVFAQRLKIYMGSYTDMALAVTVYLAAFDAIMGEFFFRGFSFLNLTHIASKRFAHLFSAAVFTAVSGVRMFGLFPPVIWLGLTAVMFPVGLLQSFMLIRFKTLYAPTAMHLGFNLGVYLTALTLLGL